MTEEQFERFLQMLDAIRLMLVAHEALSEHDKMAFWNDSNKMAIRALFPSQKEE